MCLEESKQLHDTIEELSKHVFEEYRKHMDFEPVVAMLVKNPLGEFSVQYMLIHSIYMMEGKKGERGWESLQRRMKSMAVHARRDGLKVLLVYHAAKPDDYDDDRIVIITRTGPKLDCLRECHFLPEFGNISVDETGKMKVEVLKFREL
jgi:hypothetical protein